MLGLNGLQKYTKALTDLGTNMLIIAYPYQEDIVGMNVMGIVVWFKYMMVDLFLKG